MSSPGCRVLKLVLFYIIWYTALCRRFLLTLPSRSVALRAPPSRHACGIIPHASAVSTLCAEPRQSSASLARSPFTPDICALLCRSARTAGVRCAMKRLARPTKGRHLSFLFTSPSRGGQGGVSLNTHSCSCKDAALNTRSHSDFIDTSKTRRARKNIHRNTPIKTSEKRARQGVCGRFEGAYKDVRDRKHP